MKVNLTGSSRRFVFACMTLSAITISSAWAGEAEDYLAKLKAHYQTVPPVKAFSLTQHYLQASPDQAWDYQAPNRWTAYKVTEFDLEKKHYVENVIHHFTGGLRYDEVHFQNDTDSFRYERNGVTLGKRVLRQSMGSFDRYKNLYMANIDFLAVKPLLNEEDVTRSITLFRDKGTGLTTVTHRRSDKDIKEYVFSDNPMRLVSITEKLRNRTSLYGDYQTTNGLTYARSITKYYDGEATPRFIKQIDRFDIIDSIDPVKLRVPPAFGPIMSLSDRSLRAEEIATDLYLVADGNAHRNSLIKVMGDEIRVYGGPASPGLAEQLIEFVQTQFPGKKIASVYVTHPHSDHIDGLPAYAKRGIVIQADAYSIAAIKAYPDFADDIASFTFQTIEHEQLIEGVRFYVLENAHAKRQSFAHFEDSGILYQADFLDVAFDNTIAELLPSYTKTFIDFIRRKNLRFERIVAHRYNNDISAALMDKADEANTM